MSSLTHLLQRDGNQHRGPLARGRPDVDLSVQNPRPLANSHQSESMAVGRQRLDRLLVETDAVISDADLQPAMRPCYDNFGSRRVGVLDDVVEALLHDPVDVNLSIRR